jgi:AbrB family looped-hinge helix DNA binding protein
VRPRIKGKILDGILDHLDNAGMTTITGKFQITLPKRLVDAYGLKVGEEVELVASGDTISIVPAGAARAALPAEERVRLFDEATARIKRRVSEKRLPVSKERGWGRADLYEERLGRDRSR